MTPASGPIGTMVTVRGSGCPDTNEWAGGHDGAFAFVNNVDGHENFSGAYQVPFDVAPDSSFTFTFVVPRVGMGVNGTVLDPLPPGVYNTLMSCLDQQPATFTVTSGAAPLVERWAGKDRYATSAAISAKSFVPGAAVAYVASGAGFADALSGAPVAGMTRGPVLLTAPTSLPGSIATELARLKPKKIVVLGGAGAVSEAVKAKLDAYTTGAVERWAGKDRYATSAAISAKSFVSGPDVAFVASGAGFADALSGAPVAGKLRSPVLLTAPTTLPASIAAELARLKPKKIVVLGGAGAVSDAVKAKLDAYTTGAVERWAGKDRYATSATVSTKSFAKGVNVAYVASGTGFADALSSAPVAGKSPGPVLLTAPTSLPSAVSTELSRLGPHKVVVIGGTGAVSAAVAQKLAAYIP
jgi:putative cell wall-binding protein